MMLSWHLRGIRGDRAMPHQARWLEAEFGWHAERVTEAGLALGLADLVPIACRGSSHPALLDHLARLIGARPGQTVLDGGWALGSLSTIPDLGEAARELRRVLAPGGCLAIYDFVAAGAIPADAPVANAFTPPGTAAWREPILAVEREIAHCHGGDPRYQLEARERAAFGRLQLSGRIVPWLLLVERPCSS